MPEGASPATSWSQRMEWAQLQLGFEMPARLGAAEGLLVGGLVLAGALIGLLPAWLSFRRSIAEGLVSA